MLLGFFQSGYPPSK